MKTILASTYAVNPYKGSEDGMGWNFVYQIAKHNKVIAITRENNQAKIENYMKENPDEVYQNMNFQYYDLPKWMRFWKKGERGALLYYLLWQLGIVRFVKQKKLTFDITHNLNFHNDWSPSFLWKLGKPFVWGPIGHHPKIPKQYLKLYTTKTKLQENITWLVKKAFWKFSFALKRTVKNADFIWCMNESVSQELKLENSNYEYIPSVACSNIGYEPATKKNKEFNLISAGRFVPLKGFDLAILGFAHFLKTLPAHQRENCKLKIIGTGKELQLYKNLCYQERIMENVQFIDWIERDKLMRLFKESDAFLFPSHEGAGMVVAEALSFGLPVICLDNYGPGKYINQGCGYAIPMTSYEQTVEDIGKAILDLHSNQAKQKLLKQNARLHFEKYFDWDRRGEKLKEIYNNII